MPAFIDENQQFIDPDTSAPIVNGNVFFGEQGSDPQAVPITVFVDKALTIPIAQPVKTDASGRTTQKIFIPARYSFKVTNSAGSQKLIDLDAGSTPAVGITILTNIAGANDITAQADPIITTLVDGQQFTFPAAAINTDKMTLKINGTPITPIKFNFNEEMGPGFIQQGQTINLTFNGTVGNLHFAWVNDGRGISLLTNVGGTANAITADGGPSTTGYVDQQIYSFKPNVTNTAAATLKVGTLPTVPIKVKGSELLKKQLSLNVPALAMFNSVGPVFELLNASGPVVFTTFTTNGTWTPKSQSSSALIFCIGGGGGGGGLTSSSVAGGGGGASGCALTFENSLDSSYAITIGASGAAGSSATGGTGGTSSVGTIAVSPGGTGGGGSGSGFGGGGGAPTTATLQMIGGEGQSADEDSTSSGGNGGASFIGGGGKGGTTTVSPAAGSAFGSGGGGARAGATAGAVGAPGVVFIIEFS